MRVYFEYTREFTTDTGRVIPVGAGGSCTPKHFAFLKKEGVVKRVRQKDVEEVKEKIEKLKDNK